MGIHDILAVTVFLLIEYRITDAEKKNRIYIYIYARRETSGQR